MRTVKGFIIRAFLWAMLVMSAMAANANGDNLNSRLNEIVQVVVPASGYINKEIHDSLWDLVPAEFLLKLEDQENAEVFKKQLQKKFGQAMLFQYATWDSARRTLESDEITYHPDYKKLHKITVNEGYVTAANNGDRVIQSALDRTPIENSQGMFYITKEMVSVVLNNLEVSLERASLLFTYEWKPKMKERLLQRAHVKTISAFPYAFEQAEFDDLIVYLYVSRFSERSYKAVLWLPIQEAIVPSDTVLKTMTITLLEYYGVDSSKIFSYSSKWRGLLAHQGSGFGYESDKKVNFSVATVIRTDLGGFLVLLGASEHSQGEADRYIEEILEQTQLAN